MRSKVHGFPRTMGGVSVHWALFGWYRSCTSGRRSSVSVRSLAGALLFRVSICMLERADDDATSGASRCGNAREVVR